MIWTQAKAFWMLVGIALFAFLSVGLKGCYTDYSILSTARSMPAGQEHAAIRLLNNLDTSDTAVAETKKLLTEALRTRECLTAGETSYATAAAAGNHPEMKRIVDRCDDVVPTLKHKFLVADRKRAGDQRDATVARLRKTFVSGGVAPRASVIDDLPAREVQVIKKDRLVYWFVVGKEFYELKFANGKSANRIVQSFRQVEPTAEMRRLKHRYDRRADLLSSLPFNFNLKGYNYDSVGSINAQCQVCVRASFERRC